MDEELRINLRMGGFTGHVAAGSDDGWEGGGLCRCCWFTVQFNSPCVRRRTVTQKEEGEKVEVEAKVGRMRFCDWSEARVRNWAIALAGRNKGVDGAAPELCGNSIEEWDVSRP